MASHPSRRGSNFCRFFGLGRRKNNDILGIYFVRNNCFFSDAPEPVQNKIPKKSHCFGEFSRMYFSSCFLFLIMFLHCAFWVVHDVRLGVRKNAIFSARKNVIFSDRKNDIFRVRQYGAFWLQRSHCGNGYHISLPTGLNLESAEISTSKLANSKQQMSKSILQFLKCTLTSHLLWSGGNGQRK